jgi:nitrogen fixation protein FixH
MTTASNDKLWMLFPWALLGTALAGLGLMASIAAKDPSFSLEKDYYRKATAWEQEQAQRAKNALLGWTVVPAQTAGGALLTLRSQNGEPIAGAAGEVEAFAIARAQNVQTVPLREIAPGKYEAPVHFSRAGLWELRATLHRAEDTFTSTLRIDAAAQGAP